MNKSVSPVNELDIVELLAQTEQLQLNGRPNVAVTMYREWLEDQHSPLAYAVLFNLGVALSDLNDVSGAEGAYRSALALNPHFIHAHLNLGTLLEKLGKTDEALAQWQEVLLIDAAILHANRPLHLQALNNLARLLEIKRQFQRAEQYLTHSLTLEPQQADALQHWIHLRQKQCEWPTFPEDMHISVEQMQGATSALSALSAFDDPAMLLGLAHRFVSEKADVKAHRLAPVEGYQHQKLRIAYLSSDFCLHPVALLTAELFEMHNRDKVEVYGFCWSREDGSTLRKRIIAAMDHYIPIGHLSDEDAAQCIRSHEIDILVDLQGLTSGVRLGILSRKPAPVQVTYLGYPGTTAMPSIDYVIADQFVLPPELRVHFTEQAIYLPHCFQVSDSKREIGPLPSRASCGLPDEAFVFCSFNNNYKFRPETFAVWMNILKAVPGSVLWLLADNEWAQANLCKAAENHGIPASRLVFAARVAPADYLARYQLADLFLDTTPFNAGTTANDALWMGLPLLTCVGRTFSSRMAGSLLNTLGLPELICNNLHEYQLRAIALGNQRSETAALRRRLEASRNTNALFNIVQFVDDLEHAFQGIAVHPANEQHPPQHQQQHQQQRQQGTVMHPEDLLSTPSQSEAAAFAQRIVSDLTLAQHKVEQGLNQEARALYEQVLREVPNQQAAIEMLAILTQKEHIDAAMNRFPGPQYLKWLQWLHQQRKPATYVEVGVETGASLRFAQSPTKAVGIDPDIRISYTQESWVKLFKQTSDDFFASKDLSEVLEGLPLDMAFIDGLHTFDQALRDFIHIERYSHPGTVVAFHDIFPVTPMTAARERQSIFWLGDTWKVVLILKALRPDLKIITVPTFPSGLTLVTGLDSQSDVLALDMARIIEQWMPVECANYMDDLSVQLNVVPNDFDVVAALLHQR